MANESYPELSPGDQGDWVTYLQQLLEYAGYGPVTVNADFDTETTAALTSFQVGHGIDPPGRANQVTWEALVALGEGPQGERTTDPYRGQTAPGDNRGMDPGARNALSGLGGLVLIGPSPMLFFSIFGVIDALVSRHEREEKEAAAFESLRTTGDEYRRWTLAKAAANILQDFLVSSDADGVQFATSEADRIHTAEAAFVELLHNNDWVYSVAEIGVTEGWLGNFPEDVWNEIGGRVTGLWNEMVDALRSGTPASNEGPDVAHGAINVDVEQVHQLFFSQTNHSAYYIRGR